MVIMINHKEVMKITGRQEQDYIIALLHYLQQMYEEQVVSVDDVKVQKRPQWFPFNPAFIIQNWDTIGGRNMYLDLHSQSLQPWPHPLFKGPFKRNLLSSFENINKHPRMSFRQQLVHHIRQSVCSKIVFKHKHMASIQLLFWPVVRYQMDHKYFPLCKEGKMSVEDDYFSKPTSRDEHLQPKPDENGNREYYTHGFVALGSQFFWDTLDITREVRDLIIEGTELPDMYKEEIGSAAIFAARDYRSRQG